MGFLDRFRKKISVEKETCPAAPADPRALTEIAAIISGQDGGAVREAARCVEDTEGFFQARREGFLERGILDCKDPDLIRWLGLVDILEEANFVCERDWKDEKEDFLYFLQNLEGMKRLGLTVNEDRLEEDGDISVWCARINRDWAELGCCVAVMDINSDSYVLFPCKKEELVQLQRLATLLGEAIQEM